MSDAVYGLPCIYIYIFLIYSFAVIYHLLCTCWFHHALNLLCVSIPYIPLWFLMIGGMAYLWHSLPYHELVSKTSYLCFKPFTTELPEINATWCPSSIIVDNAQAEINTLRYYQYPNMSLTCEQCAIVSGILTFTSMCRLVWPAAKIFLCLWHVRKAWAENAVKKISTVGERAVVLQMVGDIMYGNGCGVDEDPIDWALNQLDCITNTRPRSAAFMRVHE